MENVKLRIRRYTIISNNLLLLIMTSIKAIAFYENQ